MAPRLGGRRPASPKKNGAPSPAAGDNSNAADEAERIQLISFVNKLSRIDEEIVDLKAPLDSARARRKSIINLAGAAGFTAGELKERMGEMGKGSREMAEVEVRTSRHRRWLGIITPEQVEMHTGGNTPQEVRDEDYWRTEGFKLGLRGLAPTVPDTMEARFLQPFLQGHEAGTKVAMTAIAETAPKLTGGAATVAAMADRDFRADNPEVDVDEAARKLKNDPKFMARGAGEEPPKSAFDDDRTDAADERLFVEETAEPPKLTIVGAAEPEVPFEASEEEIAGQTTRAEVIGAREGGTGDVV